MHRFSLAVGDRAATAAKVSQPGLDDAPQIAKIGIGHVHTVKPIRRRISDGTWLGGAFAAWLTSAPPAAVQKLARRLNSGPAATEDGAIVDRFVRDGKDGDR